MTKQASARPRKYRRRDGWDDVKKRWRFSYKGEPITFKPSDLIDPRTGERCHRSKEASEAAAKVELRRRKDLIDAGLSPEIPLTEDELVHANLVGEIAEDASFAKRNAPELLPGLQERKRQLDDGVRWPMTVGMETVNAQVELLRGLGIHIDVSDADWEAVEKLFGVLGTLGSVRRAAKETAVEPEERITSLFEAFITFRSKASGRGQNLRQALQVLDRFRTDGGYPDTIRVIDDCFAEAFYNWIREVPVPGTDKPYSPYTQRVYFGDFKRFLRYLGRRDSLKFTPLKYMDQTFEFESPELKPRILQPEDLKTLFGAASDQLRLHMMLALNCGCNQVDFGAIDANEVDLKARTLRYKRVKTHKKVKGEGVLYPLWNRTANLLKGTAVSGQGCLLVNSRGQAPKPKTVERNFTNLAKKVGMKFSFGDLRNTGADAIKQSGFGVEVYDHLFLQHRPKSFGDRNYTSRIGFEVFKEAMATAEKRLFPRRLG